MTEEIPEPPIRDPHVSDNPLSRCGFIALVGAPKVSVVAPAIGAQVGPPVQVVLADGVAATCTPAGSASTPPSARS